MVEYEWVFCPLLVLYVKPQSIGCVYVRTAVCMYDDVCSVASSEKFSSCLAARFQNSQDCFPFRSDWDGPLEVKIKRKYAKEYSIRKTMNMWVRYSKK